MALKRWDESEREKGGGQEEGGSRRGRIDGAGGDVHPPTGVTVVAQAEEGIDIESTGERGRGEEKKGGCFS